MTPSVWGDKGRSRDEKRFRETIAMASFLPTQGNDDNSSNEDNNHHTDEA